MNVDDYETLPTNNILAHMTAGALAGVLEHCVMYPLDSVKTRMQSLAPSVIANQGIGQTFLRMVRTEGIFRPVRGMSAVVIGAGPAHALYFSCYEFVKDSMVQKVHNSRYNTLIYGAAGCVSTLIHDAVMNPAEVVKQRVQMYNSPYSTVMECVRKVYAKEGIVAFYRSYTTQLTMNIPFQSIHFMSYEFMQTVLNEEGTYNPKAHMLSGAFAGGVASAATTPLDVCKTLLNTQETKMKVGGLSDAMRIVYKLGGFAGYFKGMQARVLYTMPATAICWSTYEFFKYILGASARTEDLTLARLPESSESERFTPTRPQDPSEKIGLKPRELPSMSGAGLYGAISFNTVHKNDTSSSCSGIHKGNSLLDITHT